MSNERVMPDDLDLLCHKKILMIDLDATKGHLGPVQQLAKNVTASTATLLEVDQHVPRQEDRNDWSSKAIGKAPSSFSLLLFSPQNHVPTFPCTICTPYMFQIPPEATTRWD
jgi:hypothetical protein